jgi:hypothetical protein
LLIVGQSGCQRGRSRFRHVGDIEVIHTYEGTEIMQILIVGRDIVGVGACV